MTEQILLDPGIFIDDAELFLCIDIEIVSPLLIQEGILSVKDLESTGHIVVLQSDYVSFGKRELLTLCVINDLLCVLSSEISVSESCHDVKQSRHCVDRIFENFSLCCSIEKNPVFGVVFPQSIERPNSCSDCEKQVQEFQHGVSIGFSFCVVNEDVYLAFQQIFKENGRPQFSCSFFERLLMNYDVLLKVVVRGFLYENVPHLINFICIDNILLLLRQIFLSFFVFFLL